MTATINASTTAGVVTTADTSGILQLQTNGTAALTVDASQNVGIGTASPGAKFSLTSTGSTTADGVRLTFGSEARAHNIYSALSTGRDLTIAPYRALTINTGSGTAEGVLGLNAYEYTTFGTGSSYTERMRIDSSGNVGIGTSSPTVRLHASGSDNYVAGVESSSPYALLGFKASGSGGTMADPNVAIGANANDLYLRAGGTERARIDSSGNLLVGTTSQTPGYGNTNTGQQLGGSNVSTFSRGATDFVIVCNQNTVDGSTYYQMQFRVSNVSKGSITSTSSATSYNTSSDYRLKNTIAPMTGALDKVALLKPRTYKWNIDGSDGQGFIAHELAEVVPDCVTGEKDAVQEEQYEVTPAIKDQEGRIVTEAVMGTRTVPKYQGIDTSFLVATLTAAIQELKAIVDAQGAEIAALKGATA